MTGWPRPKLRPLPRTVSPVAEETLASYVSRLAAVNQVHITDLRQHLEPGRGGTMTVLVQVGALAAATGLPLMTLLHALPELRNRHHASDAAAAFKGRTLPRSPNTVRLACRRCMAAKNVHCPVRVWARHDQNACLRHRLWIGPGPHTPVDQADLTNLPEIVHAQQRHNTLIRRYGRRTAHDAFAGAQHISNGWERRGDYPTARARRHAGLSHHPGQTSPLVVYHTIQYPDVVSLTSVLASPYWLARALSPDLADSFYDEIRRRVHANYTPGGAADPLISWLRSHHRHLNSYLTSMRSPHWTRTYSQPFETL